MKSPYQQVKEDIRRKILDGIWPPGTLLPGEIELAEQFECARATVNRAMRELAEEGFIERKRKAGTRVCISPKRQARFDIPVVRQEIEAAGQKYRYALLDRAVNAAPDWLCERLNLPAGAVALRLNCLHFAHDMPFQLEERWINLTALPEAETQAFDVIGPNEWLVAAVPFSEVEISFSAINAEEHIARQLGMDTGQAVFLSERSTWWKEQAITYVRQYFHRNYRMTTRY